MSFSKSWRQSSHSRIYLYVRMDQLELNGWTGDQKHSVSAWSAFAWSLDVVVIKDAVESKNESLKAWDLSWYTWWSIGREAKVAAHLREARYRNTRELEVEERADLLLPPDIVDIVIEYAVSGP